MPDSLIKVLLIDDDEDDYIITADLLAEINKKQFDFKWLRTYEAGLQAILANEHDVYLLDYRLGPHDGLELLREAINHGCEAPIILLTGQGDYEVDLEAMKAGAADYLVKGQIEAPLLARSIRYALAHARTLKSLRESEARFRRLVELSPEMIAVQGESNLIYVNPVGVKLLGASTAADLVGQCLVSYVHPDDRKTVEDYIQQIPEEGKSIRPIEVKAVRLDGSLIDISLWVTPIVYDAKPALQVTVSDTTERKQLEEKLVQARKMEAVGQLAGGVAHEFNNILTAINGFAELLQTRGESSQTQILSTKILQSGQRAAELVRQLLAFSRKQIIMPRILDLNVIISSIAPKLRDVLGESVVLETSLASNLAPVKIDPSQLEQILINLSLNARDAMLEGGKLIIKTTEVTLVADKLPPPTELQLGNYVLLTVSDTGSGMSEAVKAHLFEPFFTTKEIGQGIGLGLATVFGIVKQNKGDIQVQSEIGAGTTFEIYLPTVKETTSTSLNLKNKQALPPSHKTILVVEDNSMVREMTREMLQSYDYNVIDVASGKEALEVVNTYGNSIDLLLTDVVMPGMSGASLAEQLTRLQPGLKVLFMSGYNEDVIVSHGVVDSQLDFLPKPFSMATLIHKVKNVLGS